MLRIVLSVLLENVLPGATERLGIETLQHKFPTALTDIWAVKLGRNIKYSIGVLMTANEQSELFSVSGLFLTSVSFVLPPNFKMLRTFPSNYLLYSSSLSFSSCLLSLSYDTALSDLLQPMSGFRCNFLDFRFADVIGLSAIEWVLFAFQFLILLCEFLKSLFLSCTYNGVQLF